MNAAENNNRQPTAFFSGVVLATLNANHQIYISKEYEYELTVEQGAIETHSMFAFLPPKTDFGLLYTRDAWQQYRRVFIERQLADSDSDESLVARAVERIDLNTVPVLLDATGRFTVRKTIREHLSLTGRSDRQIALIGSGRLIPLLTQKNYEEPIARKDEPVDALIDESLAFFGDGHAINR